MNKKLLSLFVLPIVLMFGAAPAASDVPETIDSEIFNSYQVTSDLQLFVDKETKCHYLASNSSYSELVLRRTFEGEPYCDKRVKYDFIQYDSGSILVFFDKITGCSYIRKDYFDAPLRIRMAPNGLPLCKKGKK